MTSRILHLSNGAAVRLIDSGAGDPVLLIHGVGLRAEAWGPQISALSASHRVIAVDLPGHGESDHLPGSPRLPDYVAWASQLVEDLELGPVSIAGHSMGALITGGMAVERADLVRRAALLCGVYRRSEKARAEVVARADEIAAGGWSILAPLERWFSPEHVALRNEVAIWLRSVSLTGYAAAYRAFAEGDTYYADRLQEIRRPILALTGGDDPNSTPEMTRAIAAMSSMHRAVVIPGHSHMVNLTARGLVTQEMTRWLTVTECTV